MEGFDPYFPFDSSARLSWDLSAVNINRDEVKTFHV